MVVGVVSSIMNSVAWLPTSVMPLPSMVMYLVLPVGMGPMNDMAVATVCGTVWAGGFAKNLVKVAPASVMALVVSVEEVVVLSSFLSFLEVALPVFFLFTGFPSAF